MSFSIIGTGSAVPECIKTNDHLSFIIDTTDEWISTRTGIKERHICTTEKLSDLACEAAAAALKDANIDASELDYIICATIRGDYISPSMACVVQGRIGATCPAFDVNAACTGFIYALDVAAGYFARKKAKKILVIASESMSKMVDWTDRSTCVLFGDGAGAVVLSEGDDLLSIKISAYGNESIIQIPNVVGNCPYSNDEYQGSYLYMNGQEVYKFVISSMCNDLVSVIEEAGITENDVDYIFPHQANIRIIDAAISRLNIDKEKFLTNIENVGNTSSASIPILLDEYNKNGSLAKGSTLALCAFGGGLTSGACVIKWNK